MVVEVEKEGGVVGKKWGGPYTKLSHPYSSHANGKTTL